MNRNKQVQCKDCFKTMRSDNLRRHIKVHVQVKDDQNHMELDYTNTGDENESSAIYRDLVNELVNKRRERLQILVQLRKIFILDL